MKVHHLDCGPMRPLGGRLVDGVSPLWGAARMCCHVLLIETDAHGLVLVDSGLGLDDIRSPSGSLTRQFLGIARPVLDPAHTAARQLERLGFSTADVRHVVLTHLDLDHAGGLRDFPRAAVHVHAVERRAATSPQTHFERNRYRPAQWAHALWETYEEASGERWFGFDAVRDLRGLPPDVLLIPLAGHTRGHTAVAVRAAGRWLLHAGDAYFFRGELDPVAPHCTPALAAFQRLLQVDGPARLANQERLRELVRDHREDVTVFSAHDAVELSTFA